MHADLITPDTVTLEGVRDVFEQAFMDAALDDDKKQIRLREEVVARVFLSESRERLQVIAYYGIKEDTPRLERLELVNRVNENYVLIRAGIDEDGDLWFDYSILLKGGATPKAVVQAVRVFLMLVPRAVMECDVDGVVD